MRILLTGASGFLGRALLPELLQTGNGLTLLNRKPTGLGIHEIVAPPENWHHAVKGLHFDICIHMAWIAAPGVYLTSSENPDLAEASGKLAEALYADGLSHFLGIGTCLEYAAGQTNACSEHLTPLEPVSPYAVAKNQARDLIATAANRRGASYTWARLFYPYGPGEHPRRIPSTFLATLMKGETLDLLTPDSAKDWIEISDVVSAVRHLALDCAPQREINIGTGIGTKVRGLAECAAEITGADRGLIRSATTQASDRYRYHVADISKLLSTGWKPSIDIHAGLTRLLRDLRSMPT